MLARRQRTRHDSVHRPVRKRSRNQRHARTGMNQHEHRHTAKGTRDDVETNARRKEHFLRLLVTAGAELLVRSDESFRSEEHTSELQSLMRISYAVFCLKKKNQTEINTKKTINTRN